MGFHEHMLQNLFLGTPSHPPETQLQAGYASKLIKPRDVSSSRSKRVRKGGKSGNFGNFDQKLKQCEEWNKAAA